MNLKDTWELSILFSGDEKDFDKQKKLINKKANEFIKKWKHKNFLQNPSILSKALIDYEVWQRNYGTGGVLGYYYWLQFELNQKDPKIKGKFNQIQEFSNTIQNNIHFFEHQISKLPRHKRKMFLESDNLRSFYHFLEKLFAQSDHLLSEDAEKIMNLKSTPAYTNWIQMTSSFISQEQRLVLDENGREIIKNFSEIMGLMNSQDKKIRDSAAKAFNDILEKHKQVAESEVNAILGNKKIDDNVRSFQNPEDSRLLSDDISRQMVNQLTEAVSKYNTIAHRFYHLKAKLLGQKKLAYHERNVEIGVVNTSYTFEQSTKLVGQVFKNLDSEFFDIFTSLLNNHQVDVFPKTGKRSGAFCAYNLISQPIFILLNHTNKLNDVLTLAHEMGHAINDELMRKSQNSLNFGTPTSTAEVASTFMEDFVLQELFKTATNEDRLYLQVMKLNQDISTIFRQVACFLFEKELHREFRKSGYLSYQQIGQIFQKNMRSYMGPAVEQSPGSENWWVYWSHIRSFFYVYSYASGLLISKSLQRMVKTNPRDISKVKDFLSAGLSDSPRNIFLKVSIDIENSNFWNQGLTEVEDLLIQTEHLAKTLHKI